MVEFDAPILAVRFLAFDGRVYQGKEVTLQTMERLLQMIRTGQRTSALLSLDEYGEDGDDFFTVDVDHGWAALAFNTWDEEGNSHMYLPVARRYEASEKAPVEIGGQTPVLKRNALRDRALAAECVRCFAETGKQYRGLEWEEAR